MPVSLVRENLRGIERKFKTQNRTLSDNNGDIPNVMTSPAIFPIGGSSDTDLKDIGTVNQN